MNAPLNNLNHLYNTLVNSPKMPLLFLGHGSPMNALAQNTFTQNFQKISKNIPTPQVIICISAHWETRGTFVTAMKNPNTIHDFYGFPPELFQVQYPAIGFPEVALAIKEDISFTEIHLDHDWGLDHGTWSLLNHLYPKANIPVLQLSIDYTKPLQFHYDLARQLQPLRKKGILFIGSGNLVHNLKMIDWQNLNTPNFGYDWAFEADKTIQLHITQQNIQALVNYQNLGKALQLAIPTPEHYIPLLYIMGLKTSLDHLTFFNDEAVGGSLTMTSVQFN